MIAYRIRTAYDNDHIVVAKNMGQAERIFNSKYWPTEIISIELLSLWVQIQDYDEQPKNKTL
jgi:hypothetical protein